VQAIAPAINAVNEKTVHHVPGDVRYAKSGKTAEIPAYNVEHKADDGIDAFGEDISGSIAAGHNDEAETP